MSITLLSRFPFVKSFKASMKYPLKMDTVKKHLGRSLYVRFDNIYTNILDAIINQNYNYLKVATSPDLCAALISMRSKIKQNGIKLKLYESVQKLPLKKTFLRKPNVYCTDSVYISVDCRVYYGKKFDSMCPNVLSPSQKIYRIGQKRYIVYHKTKSLWDNFLCLFQDQTFEFHVKYESSKYIKAIDPRNPEPFYKDQQTKFDKDSENNIIESQFVMKSSSQHFDWIITDINNIMKEKL